MKKKSGFIAALLLSLALLGGCSSSDSGGLVQTASVLPENGKTAIVSAEGSVFAANYFAEAPISAEDSSAKIQELIDKAAETGGTVYLKGGTYRLAKPITLPDNVSLRGDFSSPNTKSGNTAETVLVALKTEDNKSSAIIKTGNGCTVSGIKIWYENQNYSEDEGFGYAISAARCENVTLENISLPNCYKGIELTAAKNATVRSVFITAFSEGIRVESTEGFTSLCDISVSPVYLYNDSKFVAPDGFSSSSVTDYITANTTGIYIGNAENISLYNCSVDTAKIGIYINMPQTGEGMFSATKCTTVSCQTSVYTEEAGKNGLVFESSTFGSNGLSGSIGLYFGKNYKSEAVVSNCKFVGFPDTAMKSEGSGLTSVVNCSYVGWHERAIDSSDETLAALFSYFGISKSLGILNNYGVGMFIDCTFQTDTVIEGGNYIQNDEKSGYSVPMPDLSSVYTSSSLSPKNKNYIKASDFGVTAEAEDNGPYLQAAIDAAIRNGAGTVLLEEGTYNIKTPVILREGVYLIGTGTENGAFSTKLVYETNAVGSSPLITMQKNTGVEEIILSCKTFNDAESFLSAGNQPTTFMISAENVSGVKVSGVKLENTPNGILFSGVSDGRISDVTGSSLFENILLKNCGNILTAFCRFTTDNFSYGGYTEYAKQHGRAIEVSGGKAVLMQNSSDGQNVGINLTSTATEAADSVKIAAIGNCLVNNGISVNVSNTENAMFLSTISAPSNGYHFSSETTNKGKVSVYGTVTGGNVVSAAVIRGGDCGIYSSVFKQAGSDAVLVYGGSSLICGNIFPDIPTGTHISQSAGSVSAVGNIVRSEKVFAAISTNYMKTSVSGGSLKEQFSIKGYDANAGDNDEEGENAGEN